MLVQHSSETVLWYTPKWLSDIAREVMGGIDLDPASDFTGNAKIEASSFYSDGGLERDWFGRVFLNPPGGRVGNRSAAAAWWDKLVREWLCGNVEQAIFIGFSLNILQTSQMVDNSVLQFPMCIPRKRIPYDRSDGASESPPHPSCIVFIPGQTDRFCEMFRTIGGILNGK